MELLDFHSEPLQWHKKDLFICRISKNPLWTIRMKSAIGLWCKMEGWGPSVWLSQIDLFDYAQTLQLFPGLITFDSPFAAWKESPDLEPCRAFLCPCLWSAGCCSWRTLPWRFWPRRLGISWGVLCSARPWLSWCLLSCPLPPLWNPWGPRDFGWRRRCAWGLGWPWFAWAAQEFSAQRMGACCDITKLKSTHINPAPASPVKLKADIGLSV